MGFEEDEFFLRRKSKLKILAYFCDLLSDSDFVKDIVKLFRWQDI